MTEEYPGYRLLFEASSDGMLIVGADEKVVDANPVACHILGRTREEIAGLKLEDLYDPSLPILKATLEETGCTGTSKTSARLLRGDGSSFPAEIHVSGDGEGVFGISFRQIARPEEGEPIRASSGAGAAEYRAMVEGSADAMAIFDPNNTFRYANPAFERLMGYEPEELVGMFVPDVVHPEDLVRGAALIASIQNKPGPVRVPGEFRYRHKEGHWVYLETSLNNLMEDPRVRGMVAVCRDLTDRVQAEEALRESEERFRLLVENSQDFIVLADAENVARYASPAIERIMGYAPEEFVGTVIAGYLHPEDLEWAARINEWISAGLGPSEPVVARYRHKNGSYRHVEYTANNLIDDPNVGGVVVNCRDVTDRVLAEQRLKESEERFRALTENALDLVAVLNTSNVITYASPSFEPLLGYKPEELVGTLAADYIHPEDLEWAWPLFYEALKMPGMSTTVVIRYRHKDGSWRWFESAFSNQLDNPAVEGLVFNCRDVTERIEAERKLKESEERHRALTEHGADLTVVQRLDATISYASPSMKRVLGYRPEEWVGVAATEFIHPEDLGEAWEAFREVVESPGAIRSRTLRYRHKDGSWRYLETVCNNQLENPAVGGLIFNCRDVTDRLLAERELRESEEHLAQANRELARSNTQLEQFAYVVSHGLRSPLSSVVNLSTLIFEDYADRLYEEVGEYLQSLQSSSRRMEQLVKDILDLSRVAHTPLRRETIDLSAMARAIAAERGENWPEREVEFVIEEGLTAEGDPGLLQVVLENLLGNAWKYTHKLPRARIEFRVAEHEGARAYFVRDDGAGFDEARAAELFEPFRRLHRASEFEGTGIGLATVERIVSRHGGRVWAEGEVGKGATFYFTLGPES